MFNEIKLEKIKFNPEFDVSQITENDYGNDFEYYAKKKYHEIELLLNFIEDLPNVIFSRLTGSGSCIFAAFESKENAENSLIIFKKKFPNLWYKIEENSFH